MTAAIFDCCLVRQKLKDGDEHSRRELTILIRTVPGGKNCGRNYTLACCDGGAFLDALAILLETLEKAKEWQTHREMIEEVRV